MTPLTDRQRRSLAFIAEHGEGGRVHASTLRALERRGLVTTRPMSVGSTEGLAATITDDGRRELERGPTDGA